MSSCLSGGGGRPYGFDLEIVKSSRSSPPRPNSTSSPTSTISESSNSPLSISTRKPRTPRKRPNQTYNEAAALLSGMYPTIFPTNCQQKFTKFPIEFFSDESESSDLFLPFRETRSFDGTRFQFETKMTNLGQVQDLTLEDDFDAESILDEETDEGIDSIMGSKSSSADESSDWLKFELNWKLRFGIGGGRGSIRAWKRAEEMNYWWNFSTVDVLELSPKLRPISESPVEKKATKKKTQGKKKKKAEKLKSLSELRNTEPPKEETNPNPIQIQSNAAAKKAELMLKLNYDGVLDAWSGNFPFSDEGQSSGKAAATAGDVSARLSQIDLFSDCDIVREASVLRYKEKRRTRLFSNKIRYQVRKANADQRPRMKGRFIRRLNTSSPNSR